LNLKCHSWFPKFAFTFSLQRYAPGGRVGVVGSGAGTTGFAPKKRYDDPN
jgi:hypothetical protein